MSISIISSGMVTGVGLNAAASCAAIRTGITGFVETGFMFDGDWLLGCPVPLDQPWRGREKLIQMIVSAVQDCLREFDKIDTAKIPLLLCVAEPERPGRLFGLDQSLLDDVQTRLGKRFAPPSSVIAGGRIGGVQAIAKARAALAAGWPYCLIAGADTMLVGETLTAFAERMRLLTADNSDGFIPGEAAGAILFGPSAAKSSGRLTCLGIGSGVEKAVETGDPIRGDGLGSAILSAIQDAAIGWRQLDYRITDNSGEQSGFKETALALTRILRERKAEFEIWHPADCIGEVGAATVPCALGVALAAAEKGYAPGPGILCHFGNDDGKRVAVVLRDTADGKR